MEGLLLATCGVNVAHRLDATEIPAGLRDIATAIRDGRLDVVLTNERYEKLIDPQTTVQERRRETERLLGRCVDENDVHEALALMSIGVASLLLYVQHNVTGPDVSLDDEGADACSALAMDGEDFAAKTVRPDRLLLARLLLVEPLRLEHCEPATMTWQIGGMTLEVAESATDARSFISSTMPSWLWWAARAVAVHQRFLKHHSATLRKECAALLGLLEKHVLDHDDDWSAASRVQLCLEMAQWELIYRRIPSAENWIDKAENLLQVKIELSGAMGKRTVHQKDAKAQLIAKIHRSGEAPVEATLEGSCEGTSLDAAVMEDDILMKPVWDGEVSTPHLSPLEQCLALARSDVLELGTAKDPLQSWEMEPFAQLILCQSPSTFAIQIKARLMRVLHERERGRTRERSLLMLEKLVDSVRGDDIATDRLAFVFCVRMPGILQLRKQLAGHYVSFGIVASALSIYEELEMWEELVFCYRLLEKKAIADEIVTCRLESDPQNPSLLCTLADLRSDPDLHVKAWTASEQSYPRAQRSLARLAMERKDYKAASSSFELALNINSLHPDAWFSLGYCYLKLDDDASALRAFTWCAQLEPENGEAWNNLAALWMRQEKPERALWALKEAVKFMHRSWETWENYAKASQECGEYAMAIRGMTKVFEMSDGQRLQADLLTSLIDAVLDLPQHSSPPTADTGKVLKQLEAFLQRASNGSGWRFEFWLPFARLHDHLDQPSLAKDCLTKCFRHLQGAAWKSDPSQFALLVQVMTALIEHTQAEASQRDLASLALQLRGIVKQAERNYSDTEDMHQLQSLQSRLLQLTRKEGLSDSTAP